MDGSPLSAGCNRWMNYSSENRLTFMVLLPFMGEL
jgi:hypothetical protein